MKLGRLPYHQYFIHIHFIYVYILPCTICRSGFAGEACLLRLICETNSAQLAELNGVLGSLMHVLFR